MFRSGSCIWFAPVILTVSIISPVRGALTQSPYAEARELVAKFFSSYERKDIEGLMALWIKEAPNVAEVRQSFEDTFRRFDKIPIKGWAFHKFESTGDGATLNIVLDPEGISLEFGKAFEKRLSLHRTFCFSRESGAWKVREYLSSEEYLAERIGAAKTPAERRALVEADKDFCNSELGRALFNEGNRLGRRTQYSESLDVFLLLKDISTRIGDKVWLAGALHGIGAIQDAQGRLQESLASLEESLKLAEEAKDQDGVAFACLSLGNVSAETGDYVAALDYDKRSLAIYNEINNRRDASLVLNNIGTVYHYLGDYDSALEYYGKCLDLAKQEGMTVGSALRNIGLIYALKGDYVQAEQYLHKALDSEDAAGDKVGMMASLLSLGANQYYQGNEDRALGYFEQGHAISQAIGDKNVTAQTLEDIGNVYLDKGDSDRALERYDESRKLWLELGSQYGISEVLRQIGRAEMLSGHYAKAQNSFDASLRVAEKIGYKTGVATTRLRQAEAYLAQGEGQMAAESAGRSASIAREVGIPQLLVEALTVEGDAFRKVAKLAQAREVYAEAIEGVEHLRQRVAGGEEERQKFLDSKIAPYYGMADLLFNEGLGADAFIYAERSKARTLLDVLESGKTNLGKAMTPAEQETERRLDARLVSVNTQIIKEKTRDQPDQRRLDSLTAEQAKAREEYDSFHSGLYTAHPELRVQRGELKPISVAECADVLPDSDTALIEYLTSNDHLDIFVITLENGTPTLKCYSTTIKSEDLSGLVGRFSRHIAEKDLVYEAEARKLYDVLLKPAARELTSKSNLIIVPDGVLWELSFQVLESRQGHPVVRDYAISYAPSFTALREMSKRAPETDFNGNTIRLLAFGNGVVEKERSSRIKEVYMDADLKPLVQAESQV
ncbi:MAG TPA: tetratricopeptide repeat protein, partial [Blastocatellia bacterium]|nr:tetratricopeptide repeat protein [Blastocatellia bacterium]